MATSSGLCEDQFLCSICLEVFSEPVSIPCGHNFCKACITKHWEDKQYCRCPLCQKKFHKQHKLHVNTGFRDVVESFKKHHMIPPGAAVEAGEVPCDCCLDIKLKASKTCLACLVSYCEMHLEPHYRVPALKRHKLTDPVQKLEEKICMKHESILELFCRNEDVMVCVMCTEHKTHDTAPLEELYKEKQAELQTQKKEAKEMIQARQKKIHEVQREMEKQRKDKDEVLIKSSEVFSTLVGMILRHKAKLAEEMAAERQTEMFVKELEQEISNLRMRSTKLDELSRTEDHIQLIQSFMAFSSTSKPNKNWSEIIAHSCVRVETMKAALVKLEEKLTKEEQQIGREIDVFCGKILNLESDLVVKSDAISDPNAFSEDSMSEKIQQEHSTANNNAYDSNETDDLLEYNFEILNVLKFVDREVLYFCSSCVFAYTVVLCVHSLFNV